MKENKKWSKIVKNSVFIFVFILLLAIISIIILKYNVEGEKNMPFNLSRLFIISSAEGLKKEENVDSNWNVEIYQTNEIYLNITKNKNYKDSEIIKSIQIKNIHIDENPQVGDINIYRPSGDEEKLQYIDKNKINDEIVYIGDTKSDIGNLKISNQGGTIVFSVVNITGKNYISDESELKHDGTLIEKANITNEEISFKISFDIVINLESEISYTGQITIELPIDDLSSKGITSLDKTDMKDIVFKRD